MNISRQPPPVIEPPQKRWKKKDPQISAIVPTTEDIGLSQTSKPVQNDPETTQTNPEEPPLNNQLDPTVPNLEPSLPDHNTIGSVLIDDHRVQQLHNNNTNISPDLGISNWGFVIDLENLVGLRRFAYKLEGEMPKNISNCFNLIDLSLGANNLTGRFPLEFQSLFKLQYLALFQNNLVGEIPAYIGNFTSLLAISFIHNNFQGKIPTSLGQLNQLFFLQLSNNNLSGTIPTSIFNLSSLELLELSFNRLEGYLPPSLGSVLPILQSLSIGKNFLIGPLPISISNATSLTNFVIVENGFTGGVPSFSNHRQLDYFGLSSNPLGNGKSTDLDFMLSLLNSSATLRDLVLSQCNFGGILPRYIGNFSRLRGLYLGGNVIHGDIPNEIQFLVHMEELEINVNQQSEYGMGSDLSTCGDMYSYGILLLEIFTGKSPTCDIFNNGLTLHNYIKMAIPEQVIEIVDPKLFHEEANATPKTFVLGDRILECLVSIFKIGIACSMELPRDRMNIDNAIKELRSIKDTLVQLGDTSTIPR
nr:probable LRR receptor-like serine/threonine-protein kinase At3g47570 [Ipomoea batatas]